MYNVACRVELTNAVHGLVELAVESIVLMFNAVLAQKRLFKFELKI